MVAKAKQQDKTGESEIVVVDIDHARVQFRLLGTRPIILYRMSEKAWRELLLPSRKKNAIEKASTLKHDPLAEFAASPYRNKPGADTLLCHLSTAFKAAIRATGVDIPGASKAQLGRLTFVEGEHVDIYGIPQLLMSVVRSAGMNKTPDIRTRCIVPEWACTISIVFTRPHLTLETVGALVAAAGIMQGVGDWRPQKGSGNFGQFRIVSSKDDEKAFARIVKTGGYAVQKEAMINPAAYDEESRELLEWFGVESRRREFKAVSK